MDQVTQQNAAMVEESTAASQSLLQETEQLSGVMGLFRVEHVDAVGFKRDTLRKTAPYMAASNSAAA